MVSGGIIRGIEPPDVVPDLVELENGLDFLGAPRGLDEDETENFAAGMPTDLAFKFAARQAIFSFLEKERGEGWWGADKMADYYALASDKPHLIEISQRRFADS